LVDPEVERYWMTTTRADGTPAPGGVDLYVGGAEHAVLHLLYARFWHKVLYDLGHVSTAEPFQRLFNQGTITAAAYVDERGAYVETRRLLHRTIAVVRADMAALEFNTAIARLSELNNRLTQVVAERGAAPLEVVRAMVLMLAPLTPHVAEELWSRLGKPSSLTYEPFPEPDPALLVEVEVEI